MDINNDKIEEESAPESSGEKISHKNQKSRIGESQFDESEFKEGFSLQFENGKGNSEHTNAENNGEKSKLMASSIVQIRNESIESNVYNESRLDNNIERHGCIQARHMRKNNILGCELYPHENSSICTNLVESLSKDSHEKDKQNNENVDVRSEIRICENLPIAEGEKSMDIEEVTEPLGSQEIADLQQDNEERSLCTRMTSATLSELSVDVTDYYDPIYWDIKYASNIVDFVVRFYYINFAIAPRWNHSNYDHIPENPYVMFGMDDANQVQNVLLSNWKLYEMRFYSLVDPVSAVDQSMFDRAVNAVLQENLCHYFVTLKAFQLATTIAVFAIVSSQRGFSDALYHAVYSIVKNVRILRTCIRNPSNNLLMIFPGNMPTTFGYESHLEPIFLPTIVENVAENIEDYQTRFPLQIHNF